MVTVGIDTMALDPQVRNRIGSVQQQLYASISGYQARDYTQSTYRDIQISILRIQKDQQRLSELMGLCRFQQFLEKTHGFEKVIDHWFADSEAAKLRSSIWGPSCLIIETAWKESHVLDSLLDAYLQIGESIANFDDFLPLLDESLYVQRCMADFYEDLGGFYIAAVKMLTVRAWGKLFRSSWRAFQPTLQFLTKKMSLQRDLTDIDRRPGVQPGVYGEAGEISLQISNAIRSRIRDYHKKRPLQQEEFESQERGRRIKETEEVFQWLTPRDTCNEMHDDFCKQRNNYKGTSKWILKKEEVENWLYSEDTQPTHSILWMHAKKGAGKTILASLIVESCQDRYGYHTYYFYCKKGDAQQDKALSIFRGILRQAIERHEDLVPLCYDKKKESGGSTLTNPENAKSLLSTVFESKSRQFVIIDGLDECDGPEIKQVLTFFTQQVEKNDNHEPGKLRVLVSSLRTNEIGKQLGIANILEITERDNEADIEVFAKTEVKSLADSHNLLRSTQERIVEIATSTSKGMFLYARLLLESLKLHWSQGTLLEKCKEYQTPVGIEKLYEEIISSLKKKFHDEGLNRWPKALEILGWIVCAKRPLTYHELQGILSYDPQTQKMNMNLNMLRSQVEDLLGNLVHVIPGRGVDLIHETAKSHVIKNKHVNENQLQVRLTTICLNYLSHHGFNPDTTDDQRRSLIACGFYSFQDYAVSSWMNHIEAIRRDCSTYLADDNEAAMEFGITLERFVQAHPLGPTSQTEQETGLITPIITQSQQSQATAMSPKEQCSTLSQLQFYSTFLRVWEHICQHKKSKFELRNQISLESLKNAVEKNRTLLESRRPTEKVINNDTIELYYGDKLFKCPRVLCDFFYVGFNDDAHRKRHIDRHDRPFPCIIDGCTQGPFGFTTNKDRERHVRQYHPDLSDRPPSFTQLTKRSTNGATFPCTVEGCDRSFTRNINLKGHIRSHWGERPYPCSTCGKTFTRINDCRRHEKIHTRR